MSDDIPPPSAVVVTCIESGSLEDQCVRMVGSLRRWGGRLANLPIFAVKARVGLPIRRSIRRELEQLGVTLISADAKAHTKYHWLGFLNKPVALATVEQQVAADVLIWLDADTLIVKEPAELLLKSDTDFAAVATEKSVGSSGPTDPFEPYWQAMSESVGVALDRIGWIVTERDQRRIRLYFNSGVMAFRRNAGFTEAYLRSLNLAMEGNFAIPQTGYYLHEQAVIGFALASRQLRWTGLEQSYNYRCGMAGLAALTSDGVRSAKVLHYHRAMEPQHWDKFLSFLADDYEEVRDWLASSFSPIGGTMPLIHKAVNRLHRHRRGKQARAYRAGCRELPINAREGEG